MAQPALISAHKITRSFTERPLFQELSVTVEEGVRLAVVGPNGSGKSTLLKILAGLDVPDEGTVSVRRGITTAYVAQRDLFDESKSIAEVIESYLLAAGTNSSDIGRRVSITLGEIGIHDKEIKVGSLSGGWKKRLAIACALAKEPDVLLLDEPTNHLDIDGILWLERYLTQRRTTLVFISHDRYFIEALSTRVLEVNRIYPAGAFEAEGHYSDFLERRSAFIESQRQLKASLSNKVRREVEWLRQGVKARGTKQKARIDEALNLIDQLKGMKVDERSASIEFSASRRKTKELIKVENVSKSIEGKKLFWGLNLTLSPGVRLGIVGPNGCGKSTLVNTLLGRIEPDTGRIVKAANLRVAFFDQARRELDHSLTLKRVMAPDGDSVHFQGENIHVAAWASRFLFSTTQLDQPVSALSGGEQARALLAKLMLQETDILMFDEPTNDLDIPTLEVLEDSFQDFPGAIVLVTHDRFFLDQVATTVVGLGDGMSTVFSSYGQYAEARTVLEKASNTSRKEKATSSTEPQTKKKTKLSYQEDRELRGMQQEIERAETRVAEIERDLANPDISGDSKKLTELCAALEEAQSRVESLYSRWQELELIRDQLTTSQAQ